MVFPLAAQVASLPFMKTVVALDHLLVKSLMTRVHPGEAECLALAMEDPGALLLLDDLGAREIAPVMASLTLARWAVWLKRRNAA
jgi:predicted nucleic acid-binding protein